MESQEDYKIAQSKLCELQKELEKLTDHSAAKIQTEAHKDIENHFDDLIVALKSRKDILLRNVDLACQEIKNSIEKHEKSLKDVIVAANQIISSGSALYNILPDAAATIWKTAQKIEIATIDGMDLNVYLAPVIKDVIKEHGSVSRSSRSSVPEAVQNITSARVEVQVNEEIQYKATGVTTVAGSSEGYVDGKGEDAQFHFPRDIVHNPTDGCLYVCDNWNHKIRRVTPSGVATTFIDIVVPISIDYYKERNSLLIATTTNVVEVSATGAMRNIAGGKVIGYKDGEGLDTMFSSPQGMAVNPLTGDIYLADSDNHVIRKINSKGFVTTVAGSKKGDVDGKGSIAQFNNPMGIVYHPHYKWFLICDYGNNKLRKLTLDGDVSSVCSIFSPKNLAILSKTSVLVACMHSITKVTLDGENYREKEIFAGGSIKGDIDGSPLESTFNWLVGLTVDTSTNTCFVSDHFNNKIRAIHYA